MTATSSDAESLREQLIRAILGVWAMGHIRFTGEVDEEQVVDALIAAVPALRGMEEHMRLGWADHPEYAVVVADRAKIEAELLAQPASSAAVQSPDLRAAVEALPAYAGKSPSQVGEWATVVDRDAVLALLDPAQPERYVDPSDLDESFYRRNPDYQGEPVVDTAQPDLRRTPEAEIDVETLGRLAWDVFRPGKIDARPNAATLRWYGERIKAALAATPAPAEEE